MAFGSFAFRDDVPSVLVVPEVVLGREGGRTWLTTVGDPPRLASPDPVRGTRGLRYAHGAVPVTDFRAAVQRAVARIAAGELEKVVLAHDLLAVAEADIDVRAVLAGLAARNPDCWTFAVDGLVGATPELLVRRTGERVVSRVLAGTTARGGDADDDHSRTTPCCTRRRTARSTATPSSRTAGAGPHVRDLTAPDEPHTLELSNVTHLATDVTATLAGRFDVLDLLAAAASHRGRRWHPPGRRPRCHRTARGHGPRPLHRAGRLGRRRGDGEWGIALRCAQLDGPTARLFAGCGIVAGSDPDEEVAEAQAKFVPMRDALEGVPRLRSVSRRRSRRSAGSAAPARPPRRCRRGPRPGCRRR